MNDSDLDRLQKEVEEARARVAASLEKVAAPETYAGLTTRLADELDQAKDLVVDKIRTSATDFAGNMLDNIKARAAANPAAALAIGAGVVWRLSRHPPVATLLVGAGIVSLLRTDPNKGASNGAGAEGASLLVMDPPHARPGDPAASVRAVGHEIGRAARTVRDADRQDQILLGAAAVAVAAAVGTAYRRRRRR